MIAERIVESIKTERKALKSRLKSLDRALVALEGYSENGTSPAVKRTRRSRHMSEATKRKIARTQRLNWKKKKA